jgi:hypothetical protein
VGLILEFVFKGIIELLVYLGFRELSKEYDDLDGIIIKFFLALVLIGLASLMFFVIVILLNKYVFSGM